jgi:hypothetical protein
VRVSVAREGAPQQHVAGPGDLNTVGPGDLVNVVGEPNRERDYGLWAGALGSAILRGASVRRLDQNETRK